MQIGTGDAAGALRAIEAILDRVEAVAVEHGQRLACAQVARRLASRLTALAGVLLARAEATQESMRAAGTPTTSWLAVRGGLSKREAAGFLHQAEELARHPAIGDAAVSGRISVSQAKAMHGVLSGLDSLDERQQAEAAEVMLTLAATWDADRLSRAAPQVLAAVAPEQAADTLERRLQRQAEAARRNRSLVFGRDRNGSVTFSGSLPIVDGEAWIAILDAHAESARRTTLERLDPLAEVSTPAQRRADALVAMVTAHQAHRKAPRLAGDRPRVVVTLRYDELLARAAGAGVIAEGQLLVAGDLRRLCCDAEVLPVVLGGPSEVLDVGRQQRLVTPVLRSALALRDGGCVFPGCHTRPALCEAHHVVPWWAGGATALANLALLCHHHHALVEPAKHGVRDQWQLRIADDGLPDVVPPRRYDPEQKPLRHQRHQGNAPPTPVEQSPPAA